MTPVTLRAWLVSASALALLAGCNLHAMTGDMLNEYSVDHVGPYLMSTDDLGMACETGVSLGSQLLSYARVTDSPDQAAVSTLASAAACAEEAGFQAQLEQIRAVQRGDAAGARDARIREKRHHAVAASRYYRAYLHNAAAFGEPGESCPVLQDELDELAWLLGMLAGASAVQHDRAANGAVDVPLNVPIKVTRGVGCLDNEKWFGIPSALRAAIWLGLPGSTPEGVDVWKQLRDAAAIGSRSGVRLAGALWAKAAETTGDTRMVRDAIVAYAASLEEVEPHARFALLDHLATRQILHISDAMWTEAKGHRTPHRGLGTFWETEAPELEEDLFEGLDAEEDTDTDTDTPAPE